MSVTYYINQNGRIACTEHGGAYLRSETRTSQPATVDTPLDNWERISQTEADDFVEWVQGTGVKMERACEGCI